MPELALDLIKVRDDVTRQLVHFIPFVPGTAPRVSRIQMLSAGPDQDVRNYDLRITIFGHFWEFFYD